MESYSQAGQDIFVRAVLSEAPGTFLDVGCNHPVDLSNTYALERLGWRGLLVDSDEVAVNLCREQRKSPVLLEDATKLNWRAQLQNHKLWPEIDYLSLDCDHASLDALRALLTSEVRFKLMTIEHDAYRFGDGPRSQMRELLLKLGYAIVCGDVRGGDCPFEDWWVDLTKVRSDVLKFACSNTEWSKILADAGY